MTDRRPAHPLDGDFTSMSPSRLRKLGAGIRERAERRMSPEEFEAQARKFLAEAGVEAAAATVADWVKAAMRVRHGCTKCRETGTYVWGLRGEYNGVCYRCEGKGWQHDADRRRNWGYDNYDAGMAEMPPHPEDEAHDRLTQGIDAMPPHPYDIQEAA